MRRAVQPIRRPDWSKLDRRNPFNKDYPGWAGCQLALMGFPHLRGGPTWVDPWHKIDGTLTNMDPATDWVATEYGAALNFDGVNDYVSTSSFPSLWTAGTGLPRATVVICRNGSSLSGDRRVLSAGVTSPSRWYLGVGTTPDSASYYIGNGAQRQVADGAIAGRITHYVMQFDGSVGSLAINGSPVDSYAVSYTPQGPFTIGSYNNGQSAFWNGDVLAVIAFVGVTVSPRDHYDQWRHGFPDALRWLKGRSMVSAPAGGGGVMGAAAFTEDSDTVSAAGVLAIVGSLAITEANDAVAAAAAVAVLGSAASTQDSDTVAAAGAASIAGEVAITQDSDTVAAVGAVNIVGSVAITEDDDTVHASTSSSSTGTVVITQDSDVVAAAGSVAISGAASSTQADDTVAAAAALAVAGLAAIAEDSDTVAAVGTLPISVVVAITQDSDTVAAGGVAYVSGSATITEDGDTVSAGSRRGRRGSPLKSSILKSRIISA